MELKNPGRRSAVTMLGVATAALTASAWARDSATGGADGGPPPQDNAASSAAQGIPADATMRLAEFATTLTADGLPADMRSQLQLYLLDNVATMLAGVSQPVHADVVKAMAAAAGRGVTQAIGGAMVPLNVAAMLDGLSAADFEFEHVIENAHPSSAAFPALLLLAAERNLPGADLIAAIAASYELGIRIGDACTTAVEQKRGFHNPGVNGTLASAAGCARLLKLDAATCASAMGLAGSSSAGLLAFVETGAMTKRLHPARSAQLGMEAALMAQAGVQGPVTVLEDKTGSLLRAFSPSPDGSRLLPGLGTDWRARNMIMKLSPVHAYAQYYVRSLNKARSAGGSWEPAQVSAVEVDGSSAAMAPGHMDRAPTTLVAAQYSVPFSIAVAIARDLRNPLQVNDSAITDPQVVRLMKLMTFRATSSDPKQLGGTVRMTVAGRSMSLNAADYPGFPGSAGYAASVGEKFDQVLAALSITNHGAALRRAVDGIADPQGPATLRRAMLVAAAAAHTSR